MDHEWVENLRGIMMQSVEAGRPCDLLVGTVTGVSPVAVRIDQKLTVAGNPLIIPRSLTDHKVVMELPEAGSVEVTVRNALKTGERVLMLQKRGAQQYLVLDRC